MYPGWPPRYGGPSAPPAPAGPPPGPAFQSLHDQHLAQLEQLQRMHQRQLESVLPAGAPAPPPRQYYTPPRPPAAYPFPPPPHYGHSVPPPDYQQPLAPPPPAEPEQPPPPPAPEQPPLPPPLPSAEGAPQDDKSATLEPNINLTEDPEQAQRLKTLQEAAAHWQQHEQHRLGFQYQGIIQKHSALQQLLQRYQQLLHEPPHLAAMSVDVQLQHYELQQKQFSPLHQEWESQFKKWQELLQTYPHKDQLQEYHVQWTSWQAHMKATKSQLKEKVTSVKSLKQQYGGSHYIAVVPQYPSYSQVMPPTVPPGINMPPPFAASGPPMYSSVPPPPLPTAPAAAYPEAAPPLPPMSAPPLPPVTSAPPPPPPGDTSSVEEVQPPLPPENTGSTEAALPCPSTLNSALPPEMTNSTTQLPPSSDANSLIPFSAPAPPPVEAEPPGDQALHSSLSYQAQQALKNSKSSSYIPAANNAPTFPSHNNPPELPTTDLSSSQKVEKLPDPKDVDPKPFIFSSGQSNMAEKETAPPAPLTTRPMSLAGPRLSGQDHGSPTSRFPAPRGGAFDAPQGSHGFHGPRPFPDGNLFQASSLCPLPLKPPNSASDVFQGQSQHFTRERPAESALGLGDGDKSMHSLEPGVHMQTPRKQAWERGEDNRDVGKWDKVQGALSCKPWDEQHHVSANRWDQPEEPRHQTWDRPASLERSWDKTARNKWDAKDNNFTSRTGRSEGQENVHVLENPEFRTDKPDRPGLDRSEGLPKDIRNRHESSQFNRVDNQRDQVSNKWGDHADNSWSAPDPQHDRWSGPDKVPQERWGIAENTPGRFGDAGGPGSDRVRNLEGPPLDKFNVREVPFPDRYSNPESANRLRFGTPEIPPRGRARFPGGPPRGRFLGPTGFIQDRFGNSEGLARDRFGDSEGSHRDPFICPEDPPKNLFESPNFPLSRDRFGGPELPPDTFRGSELPPTLDKVGLDRTSHDNWDFSEEHDKFDSANNFQDSWVDKRPPFNNRWDSRDKSSERAERHPDSSVMEGRPPLPIDDTRGKKELHVDERWKRPAGTGGEQWRKYGFSPDDQKSSPSSHLESGADQETPDVKVNKPAEQAPPGAFHSPFLTGNQMFKSTSAEGGKTEKDIGIENVNKTSNDRLLNKDNISAVQGPSQMGRAASPQVKEAAQSTDSSLPKTEVSVLPKTHSVQSDEKDLPDKKMNPRDEVTAPVSNAAKLSGFPKSSAISSSKLPSVSDTRVPAPEATKPDTPWVSSSNLTAQTPVSTKPDDIQVSSDISADLPSPSTAKIDPPTTFSSQSAAPQAPSIRPGTAHISMPGTPQAIPSVRPGIPQVASPFKPGPLQASVPVRPGPIQASVPVRPGPIQASVPVRPGPIQASVPVRPGPIQASVPVRPGPLQASVPVRPGPLQASVPVRPGAPRGPFPIRPGAPRGPFPVRPGVSQASPPVRPGAPRLLPPARPRAPWASPSIRQGIPQASPPIGLGQVRAARPVRPSAPRLLPPVRPGDFQIPSFDEEFNIEVPPNEGHVYEESIVADQRVQSFYKGGDVSKSMIEPQTQSDHDPIMERKPFSRMSGTEGHHGHVRQSFPNQDMDSVEGHLHHDATRLGGSFRDYEMSDEPEYYPDDFSSQGPRRGNFDSRFNHPSRGRSRGFVRDRLLPRPGSREIMDVPSDRSFVPGDPFLDERPPFREGPDDLPPFDRETFNEEQRFFERERFQDPLLDDRRRDLPVEGPRSENWERDRYWCDREAEFTRDPYFREDALPLPVPPLTHDLDVRSEPWLRERNLDREGFFSRAERRYLFEADVARDCPRIPERLDVPLRERDWLPSRRSLSPHRPFSPVQSRSSLPPLPPLDNYLDDRWRLERDLADRDFRERMELRIREYPDPLWREDRKRNEFQENPNLDPRDDRWFPSERVTEEGMNVLPAPSSVARESLRLPGQSTVADSEPAAHGVVALSQRQHEIILKAAQELKMLREQKEQLDNLKNFFGDSKASDSLSLKAVPAPQSEVLQMPPGTFRKGGDVVAGTLPPSVGGRGRSEHWDEDSFSGLWDEERQACQLANLPVGSKLSGFQQTVDYAHGRDLPVGKVEQTPYGERVVLLPEPALERGTSSFPKDYLIDCFDRDLRDRDPYFERQSSKHLDRRGYDRERERDRDRSDTHRDRGDHDRERFDRPSREERSSSSYRDKESSNRRSGSDKPSYERKAERSSYEAPPSTFGATRRTYPEERPVIPPPVAAPPPEKKPETKNVDDLLKKPGRGNRPDRIVVIMRGLPGSGKTHVAKLIRDKEVECGGSAPRVLSLDDYFMTEVEKVEKDPESGRKIIRKVMEYEYEPEVEDTYRSGMLKTFKKTLDDGFFPFIILDSIHDRVRHFEQFWSAAKTKGFEVYLAEITVDVQTCAKRNVHGRKLKEIHKMADNWEPAPRHMIRLDIRSLLQDAAIEEVEMEDSEPSAEAEQEEKKEALEEEESERGYLPKSRWEMDTSEAKLDKLDGLKTRKRDWESMAGCMEDYLQLPDDYDSRESAPGKKRVRWADLEEKKDADRKRAIGFIVGQTDWEKITDKSGHLAKRALNRTKYI
ncbi:YLP motif-containing protein 1 isoform X2 [Rhinoderma darwinii]|uniref:YLP motif-containing protein 1 isoform X2 n=1 Tax=Rhinoderma darwinii TaxID=43563 RepID=UPI003F681754